MNYRMSLNIGPITHYGANGLYAPYTGGGAGPTPPSGTVSTLTVSTITLENVTGNPAFIGSGDAFVTTFENASGTTQINMITGNPSGVYAGTAGFQFTVPLAPSGSQNHSITASAGNMTIQTHEVFEVSVPGGLIDMGTASTVQMSSLWVSSINGAVPGGGSAGYVSTIALVPAVTWDSGTGPTQVGPAFSTTNGKSYSLAFNVDSVSSFATPAVGDRISFLIGADVLQSVDLTAMANFNLHNPKGFQVGGWFTAGGDGTGISVYGNGTAPSTLVNFTGTGSLLLSQLN